MSERDDDATSSAEAASEPFDWHREPEGVLRWALPTALSGVSSARFDELSERTHAWTRVDLRLLVNGVELPGRPLLEGLARAVENEGRATAARALASLAELETIRLTLEALEDAVAGELRRVGRRLGLTLEDLENGNEDL